MAKLIHSYGLGATPTQQQGASFVTGFFNLFTGASQQGVAQGTATFNNALNANAVANQSLYASMQPSRTPLYIAAGIGVLAVGVLAIAAFKK